MLAYLAGPIDGVSDVGAIEWRSRMRDHLAAFGVASFSPAHAFHIPEGLPQSNPEVCSSIILVNDQAVRMSDFVLAKLDGQSFGTPLEVKFAWDQGIPVVAFGLSERSIYQHGFLLHRPTLEDLLMSDMIQQVRNYHEQRKQAEQQNPTVPNILPNVTFREEPPPMREGGEVHDGY